MKNLMFALLGAGLLAACQTQQAEVSGTLTGVGNDTLLVRSFAFNDRNAEAQIDTVPMQNGTFAFHINDSVAKQVIIGAKPSTKPNADGSIPAVSMKAISFVLLPGKPVTVTGSIDNYTLEGDVFYTDCAAIGEAAKVIYTRIDSVYKAAMALKQANAPKDSIDRTYARIQPLQKAIIDLKRDYISQNPDKDAALYLLAQTSLDVMTEFIDSFSEPVKNGPLASLYQDIKLSVEKGLARRAAAEKVKDGNPAPEFTLKDLEGKDFSLASLRGKYVVLDFWGSWCGWCIKGIPDMKKVYAKHKDKVEFVGIDCNDTEEKWKKAVAEHQLPWINVRNEDDNDVSVMYAVSGYPTKYIIDPEGKIVKCVIGEDPAFYTFLEKLLKK